MPNLPQRKVGIVACSGEELAEGTVTRLAALKVLEELRPAQTVTICLPLFLAGGEGDRAFAKFYPTIAVDGCEKRCAARATELYSNKPAASLLVGEVLARHGLPPPQGVRRLTPESRAGVDALAAEIAAEVDHLMAVRWSRTEGAILEGRRDCGGRQHQRLRLRLGHPRHHRASSTGRRSKSWRSHRSWSWRYGQGLRAGQEPAGADHGHGAGLQRDPGGRRGAVGAGDRPGLAGLLRRQGRAGIRNGSGVILMANTATYTTEVAWKGEHLGHLVMGNGPEMAFSAPPDAHGHAGVLTPEDAFVAAANTCIMMMFLWACERFKLDLVSYRCRADGTKRVEIDRTETFTHLRFWPEIVVRAGARRGSRPDRGAHPQGAGLGAEVQPGGEFGQERDHRGTRDRGAVTA